MTPSSGVRGPRARPHVQRSRAPARARPGAVRFGVRRALLDRVARGPLGVEHPHDRFVHRRGLPRLRRALSSCSTFPLPAGMPNCSLRSLYRRWPGRAACGRAIVRAGAGGKPAVDPPAGTPSGKVGLSKGFDTRELTERVARYSTLVAALLGVRQARMVPPSCGVLVGMASAEIQNGARANM